MIVTLEKERETKGTIRFEEKVGPLDEPALGKIYFPKRTLKEIGWEPGKVIVLAISVSAFPAADLDPNPVADGQVHPNSAPVA